MHLELEDNGKNNNILFDFSILKYVLRKTKSFGNLRPLYKAQT